MTSFTFSKKDRLHRKKDIDAVFKSGKTIAAFPVLGIWQLHNRADSPTKTGFSVPKKKFRKAVSRNLIKRRMRESWRLRKQLLDTQLDLEQSTIHIMVVYIGKEELSFAQIDRGIKKLLKKIGKEIVPTANRR